MDPRISEQFNLRSPFKLEDATVVVLAQIGSHSHNTYVPKDDPQAIDDVDFMGIVIPPVSFTLGIREWDGLNFQFEELDCVFYSFRKFIQLCIKSNPNVLGLLWLRPEDYFVYSSEWEDVVESRHLFSSRRAYPSFIGYAKSQFSRMTSFDIAAQNKFDDALQIIHAAGWTKEQILENKHQEYPTDEQREALDNLLETFYDRDKSYIYGTDIHAFIKNAATTLKVMYARHFQGYMGEKRKSLVRKFGYDTKNAAHLIRLMRMCCEFLATAELNVFRTTDAQEIRDIKSGKWTLDDVKTEAERLFTYAEKIKDTSLLPETPNESEIDELVVDCYMSAYDLEQVDQFP
jgi:predicted nucleotidyltransferase